MKENLEVAEETEIEEIEETEETLTVKELAQEIGTTPRLLRKFLRAETVEAGGKVGEDTPGKGGRYAFTRDEADEVSARFEAAMAPSEEEDEEVELDEPYDTSDPH